MVETLPRSAQLKLNQTLAQWHSWQSQSRLKEKPKVVRLLSAGLSNYSVLVESSALFVVRIDGINPATIGLSRQTEWKVLQSASSALLAPCPRYYNPELGTLVYDYLPADPSPPDSYAEIAKLLQGIHQLPTVHFRLDLRERLTRYEKHIEHSGSPLPPMLARYRNEVLELIEAGSIHSESLVLCHNDLLAANRIFSNGKLHAIDWEYCAMGNAFFDLAVVSVGDFLSAPERNILLSTYLGRSAHRNERLELSRQESIYSYLELLWFCALDDPEERSRQLSEQRFVRMQTFFENLLNPENW